MVLKNYVVKINNIYKDVYKQFIPSKYSGNALGLRIFLITQTTKNCNALGTVNVFLNLSTYMTDKRNSLC